MSITDELREFIDSLACHKDTRDMMRRIADRIDKEHAEAVADALRLRGEPDRWVELPVDADGVPIHIGDEIEFFNGNHDHVRLLALTKSGWSVNSLEWNPASLHHVKPDSWERIMDDAEKLARGDNAAVMELVERCRRLAGEGE